MRVNYGKKDKSERQQQLRKVRICNGAGANRSIKSKSPKVHIIRHSDQKTFTTIYNGSPVKKLSSKFNKIDNVQSTVTKLSKLVLLNGHAGNDTGGGGSCNVAFASKAKNSISTKIQTKSIHTFHLFNNKLASLNKVTNKSNYKKQVTRIKPNTKTTTTTNMIIDTENHEVNASSTVNSEVKNEHVSHDTSKEIQQLPDSQAKENLNPLQNIPQIPNSLNLSSTALDFIEDQFALKSNLKCMNLTLPSSTRPTTAASHASSCEKVTGTSYDKEATRDYIKKQQGQRKVQEKQQKMNKIEEKQLIKQRLKMLQEKQKNLVKANVQKHKKVSVQQKNIIKSASPSSPQRTTMEHKGSINNVSSKSFKKPLPQTKNIISRETVTTAAKSDKPISPQTPIRLPTSNLIEPISQGMTRNSASHFKEDLFSPLKLDDVSILVPATQNIHDISRPWNNTTQFGDMTLNLDRSSLLPNEIQIETKPLRNASPRNQPKSSVSPRNSTPRFYERPYTPPQQKSTADESSIIQIKSPQSCKKSNETSYMIHEISVNNHEKSNQQKILFNESQVKASPYTFMTALNRKLAALSTPHAKPATEENFKVEKIEEVPRKSEPSKALPPTINFNRPLIEEESELQIPSKLNGAQVLPLNEKKPVSTDDDDDEDAGDTASEITTMKSESVASSVSAESDEDEEDSKKENIPIMSSRNESQREQYSSNFEPLKGTSSKENSENNTKFKNNLEKFKEKVSNDDPVSTKSDDIVLRRHHYANIDDKLGFKSGEEYTRLLSDFKNSLKNFMELNQKLQIAKKSTKVSQNSSKTSTKVESSKRKHEDLTSKSEPEAPVSYSNSFDSYQSSDPTIDNAKFPLDLNELSLVSLKSSAASSSKFTSEAVATMTKSSDAPEKVEPQSEPDSKSSVKEMDKKPSSSSIISESQHTSTVSIEDKVKISNTENKSIKEKVDTIASKDDSLASIETESSITNLNISYSTVGMIDQLIYNSVLKENHVLAACEIRAKSIIDRLKSSLAYLELKKQKIKKIVKETEGAENEKFNEELYSIRKKQRAILIKLEHAKRSLQVIFKLQSSGILGDNSDVTVSRKRIQKNNLWSPTKNHNILSEITKAKVTFNKGSAPLKCFEMSSTIVLEKILMKRERQLEERRKKLNELIEWQKKLDEEQVDVMQMEEELVTQNLVYLKKTNEEELVIAEKDKSVIDASPSKIAIQNSSCPGKTEKSDDNVMSLTGTELNLLWLRLTGKNEEKYQPESVFNLSQKDLKKIYDEASDFIFATENHHDYLKQMINCQKTSLMLSGESITSVTQELSEDKEPSDQIEFDINVNDEEVFEKEETYPDTFSHPLESENNAQESVQEKVDSSPESQLIHEVTRQSEKIEEGEVSNANDFEEELDSHSSNISSVEGSKSDAIQVSDSYNNNNNNNGLPDIINEAEVLRIQQLQIEQEIEQLQRVVSFSKRENLIPNKPPPPYSVRPEPEPKIQFPSHDELHSLVSTRIEQLYKPPSLFVVNDSSLNIYERLIVDMAEEVFTSLNADGIEQPKLFNGVGMKVFFQQVIVSPRELAYLQEFSIKKISKVCAPMEHGGKNVFKSCGKTNDLVDQVLLQQVLSEDQQWNCFDDEENEIKNDMVCSIIKRLINEAVNDILEIL